MNEELTNLIIKKLGKHHDRNDIIGMVCERSTLSWTEAAKLHHIMIADFIIVFKKYKWRTAPLHDRLHIAAQ